VALDDARSLSLDILPPADAGILFARIVGTDRIAGQAEAVARVVECCGGLPLAVRIAGARLRTRPSWRVQDLADQLADHRAVVGRLDDGERSVLAALALSVEDLDADRERMFRRLSLHPGADIDAGAAAALDGVDPASAGRVLEDLLDDHLLLQAVAGRYRFHDLVRAYAAQLQSAKEPDEVRRDCLRRLFDYYLTRASDAVDLLYPAQRVSRRKTGPAQAFPTLKAALAWLDAERANLVAVSAFAATHDHPDVVVKLSVDLFPYLDHAGHWGDALAMHSLAHDIARGKDDRTAEVDALMRLGETLQGQGRDTQAARYFRKALDHYVDLADLAKQAHALVCLGVIHWRSGPYDIAADYLNRALTIERELGNAVGEADALDALGLVLERQGRDEEAAEVFRNALPLFRAHNDHAGEAGVLDSLGCIASRQSHHQAAIAFHQQAIAIHRQVGSRIGEANAINDLGLAHRRRGDHQKAIDHHEQALATFTAVGNRGGESEARNGLGEALLAAGHPRRAQEEHTTALTLAVEIGDRYEQARAHTGLAHVHKMMGNLDAAAQHHHTGQAIEHSLSNLTAEDVT
jgi:tetratricopeptide (TPR) repeat protein